MRTKDGVCNDIWIPHLATLRTILIIIESYSNENKDENKHVFRSFSLVECRKTNKNRNYNSCV